MNLDEYLHSADQIEEIYREAKMLKGLDHKNIVKLIGTYVIKNQAVMIMELCEGGELIKFVEDREGITEIEARNIIRQII
jgi:serine/threonine protein kinase